jgi:hypothetical protein
MVFGGKEFYPWKINDPIAPASRLCEFPNISTFGLAAFPTFGLPDFRTNFYLCSL